MSGSLGSSLNIADKIEAEYARTGEFGSGKRPKYRARRKFRSRKVTNLRNHGSTRLLRIPITTAFPVAIAEHSMGSSVASN